MSIIEEARQIVRAIPITKDLEDYFHVDLPGVEPRSSTDWIARALAEALRYQITVDVRWLPDTSTMPRDSGWYPGLPFSMVDERDVRITDEHAFPLGASKYRGLPHLPRGMHWPEGLYFGAQLDLAALAKVDQSDRLPKDGMLYLFYSTHDRRLECKVIHWVGPRHDLEVRGYPDLSTLPGADYTYDRFRVGEPIEFGPHWIIRHDGDDLSRRSGPRRLLGDRDVHVLHVTPLERSTSSRTPPFEPRPTPCNQPRSSFLRRSSPWLWPAPRTRPRRPR